MRKVVVILTVWILLFVSCTTYKQLVGHYNDGKHIEFVFTETPNKFEYYLRSEMGVLEYSTGSWTRSKNQVILNGFTDSNIKTLSVEDKITDNADNKSKVLIQYTTENNLVKTDVIINDNTVVSISSDTTFSFDLKIKTVQIKSYLSYKGLLSSPPKIDTLYSSKIEVDNSRNKNKEVFLKFTVHPCDFVRTKLTDTITVKNNHTLYLNKTRLKKNVPS